ncbi:MAG: peroxiredoxin [Rhodospirillales bacterium]|jgi:peroxiredoxin|nr:peroxiredoxin [Rhodospirillales bacterium]MDP6772732.1 peroxiredoxin [Rhodospirillales bacterium]
MADDDFHTLPDDLPVPVDDGACDHLTGMKVPSLALPSTAGGTVDLARADRPFVLYCYPLTGRPGTDLPADWDDIPGARGCTPQTCAFRDHAPEIANLGHDIFAMSSQATDYQREMADRLDVPFAVLSDADLAMTRALGLPTFDAGGMTLIKRLTLIVDGGVIRKVFYPVFPSHEDPSRVVAWLTAHGG